MTSLFDVLRSPVFYPGFTIGRCSLVEIHPVKLEQTKALSEMGFVHPGDFTHVPRHYIRVRVRRAALTSEKSLNSRSGEQPASSS